MSLYKEYISEFGQTFFIRENEDGSNTNIPNDILNRDFVRMISEVNQGISQVQPLVVILSDQQKKDLATEKSFAYVRKFYSSEQLTHMTLFYLQSKPKALQVYAWIAQLQDEATDNWENPNYEQFGSPPYTYREVVSE